MKKINYLISLYIWKIIWIKSIFVLFLSLLFLIAGCNHRNKSNQVDRGRRFSAVSVEVKILESRLLLNEFFTTGTILANEKVELRSEVSGRITGIYFEEGSQVRKGNLLLKIFLKKSVSGLSKSEVFKA